MNSISVGVWTYGMCTDRYVGDGYKDKMLLEERISHIGKIKGAKGIEITYPGDINEDNYQEYKILLDKYNLSISGMGVEIVCDKKWATGSFSSPIESIRNESVELVKKAMDFADSIGVGVVSLWFGQDGFDYMFQVDYAQAFKNMVECIKVCAKHKPNIKLGIEYKVSEPRLKCMINSASKALSVCLLSGCENVGVTLDVGHALNAGENLAEVVSLLISQNRLFHLHLNDNYLIADDDMPIGSVHFLQFLEMFYWLKKLGYKGWYSLDMYPYRDDPDEAVKASITFIEKMDELVDKKFSDFGFQKEDLTPSKVLSMVFDKIF